jgi:hypothetical protein
MQDNKYKLIEIVRKMEAAGEEEETIKEYVKLFKERESKKKSKKSQSPQMVEQNLESNHWRNRLSRLLLKLGQKLILLSEKIAMNKQ